MQRYHTRSFTQMLKSGTTVSSSTIPSSIRTVKVKKRREPLPPPLLTKEKMVGGVMRLGRWRDDPDDDDNCGSFERLYRWRMTGVRNQGIIFQHIERTFNIEVFDPGTEAWTRFTTAQDVDAYATNVQARNLPRLDGWESYWECWTIPAGYTHTIPLNEEDDQFAFAAIIPANNFPANNFNIGPNARPVTQDTTRGSYTMTGTAYFMFTHLRPEYFGLVTDETSPAESLPVYANQLGGPYTGPLEGTWADSNVVQHTVTVTWDSTVQGPNDNEYGEVDVVDTLP